MKPLDIFIALGFCFVVHYCASWLHRLVLHLEDNGKCGGGVTVLSVLVIILNILSLPVSILYYFLQKCRDQRILRQHDDNLRFVSNALQAQRQGLDAMLLFAKCHGRSDLHDAESFDMWIRSELQRRDLPNYLIPSTCLY